MPIQGRRVLLITEPPHVFTHDGLIFVDFGQAGESLLAYKPSVLFAAHAACDAAIRQLQAEIGEVVAFKNTG